MNILFFLLGCIIFQIQSNGLQCRTIDTDVTDKGLKGIASLSEVLSVIQSGRKLMNSFDDSAFKSLYQLNGCNMNVFPKIKDQEWNKCMEFTFDLTDLTEIVEEVLDWAEGLSDIVDSYNANLASCLKKREGDEVTCALQALAIVTPDFIVAVDDGLTLVDQTVDIAKHIDSDVLLCVSTEQSVDVKKMCPNGFGIFNAAKNMLLNIKKNF